MPDPSLALSIPGLFLTCVQYFTLVQLGRNFEADFGSCVLQLRAVELRLQRWGKSVGITDELSEDFVRRLQEQHDAREIEFAYDACEQIAKQLSRAQEDSLSISKLNRDPEELALIDEIRQLELSDKRFACASRVQARLKSGYEKGFKFTARIAVRTKWALYKKTQLSSLLSVICDHVAQLENLFPKRGAELATAEAKDLEPEVIQTLKTITETIDPLLSRALEAEAGRQGFVYQDLEAKDEARVHWGNNYNTVPKVEGRQIYKGIVSGGNSVSQAGNNYNISSPPVYNAPGSKDRSGASKPGAPKPGTQT